MTDPISIAALVAALPEARAEYEVAEAAREAAYNKLRTLQRKFDEAVGQVRGSCMIGAWGPATMVAEEVRQHQIDLTSAMRAANPPFMVPASEADKHSSQFVEYMKRYANKVVRK